MGAVFKRELRTFFTNPIGYVVVAVFFCISGFFFFTFNMAGGSADLSYVYGNLFSVVLLTLPLLTMRLFSEEKRQKSDQALLTAPVSLTGIVMGKFLATVLLYVIGLSITLVYAVVIAFGGAVPDWTMLFGNYIGLALVGGMIIAVGVFVSALTESQVIAAIGTLAISMALMCVDLVGTLFASFKWIAVTAEFLSITSRYSDFALGLIYYDNIFFFLSIQALFIFLTVRVLDKKRWN
jgi:ABC-2 type transport system permease protein